MSARFHLRPIDADGAGPDAPPAVALFGEVDATNTGELEAALGDLAARPLILDLSGLEYFASAGFELLDRFLARGVTVVIAPGSVIRRAAEVMNVPFHATLQEARAALRGSSAAR